jgi:transposase
MGDCTLEAAWRLVLHELERKGRIDWNVAMADATFVAANRFVKDRGGCVGLTKVGKGSKLMVLIDGQGLPMAVSLDAANDAEVHLIQSLLDEHQLELHSPRLIYDRAADPNKLRDELAADGIQLITPHRKHCRNIHPSYDCRVLKRYKQRWNVERTIAWLSNDRRLVTRDDHNPNHFLACVHRL